MEHMLEERCTHVPDHAALNSSSRVIHICLVLCWLLLQEVTILFARERASTGLLLL
jgi:hypothetical protein